MEKETSNGAAGGALDRLPDEMHLWVFSFLDYKDVLNLFMVSKRWRALLNDEFNWKNLIYTQFGISFLNDSQKLLIVSLDLKLLAKILQLIYIYICIYQRFKGLIVVYIKGKEFTTNRTNSAVTREEVPEYYISFKEEIDQIQEMLNQLTSTSYFTYLLSKLQQNQISFSEYKLTYLKLLSIRNTIQFPQFFTGTSEPPPSNSQDLSQILSNSNSNSTNPTTATTATLTNKLPIEKGTIGKTFGCVHYQRSVKIQATCCGDFYVCRYCHNAANNHSIDRYSTQLMMCMFCGTIQLISRECQSDKCKGRVVGLYFCNTCRFWDNDENKDIFHCDSCRVCKRGRVDDSFHCPNCNKCYLAWIKSWHSCIQ